MYHCSLGSITGGETGMSEERIKAYKAECQHAYFSMKPRTVLETMPKGTNAASADRNVLECNSWSRNDRLDDTKRLLNHE